MPRVLAVSHDAGGARALVPVVEALAGQRVPVEACVAGPAAALWPLECVSVDGQEVADDIAGPDARALLERHGIDTLLSASGLYNRVEHTFRVEARALGVRTVAVLDSWLNYAERFERQTDGHVVQSRPDVVCVPDDDAYRAMRAVGFTPEQLTVTGSPNLEASVGFIRRVDAAQRAAWRTEDGLPADAPVLVFFSDPFATGPDGEHFDGPGALIGPDGRSLFGYTAEETLRAVLEELEAACAETRRRCTVLVRPHPAECDAPLRRVLDTRRSRWVDAIVRRDRSAARWIAVADAVIGMMTIALLEAALAGRPALSVQLGLRESGAEDPCVGNRLGYTHPIHDRAALGQAMQRVVAGAPLPCPSMRPPLPIEGAARRVSSIVLGHHGRSG